MSSDEYDITISDVSTPPVPGRRLNNLTATTDPTASDDEDQTPPYEAWSVWLNTTTGDAFYCADPSSGSADWRQFGSGGANSLHPVLSVSGAHTVDFADGAVHDLTLTGNATLTFDGAVAGSATELTLLLRQDGTGGRTVTWASIITWENGDAPILSTAADDMDVLRFLSVDDGATWFGFHGQKTLDDLTDVVITSPSSGESLVYDGANWVNDTPATVAALDDLTDVVITSAASGDALIFDGSSWVDIPSARHAHIVGEAAVGDGSTTVFYLAQEAEADTVAAYAAGARVSITQSTTEPDKITFTAAPGAGNAIAFDYIPVSG